MVRSRCHIRLLTHVSAKKRNRNLLKFWTRIEKGLKGEAKNSSRIFFARSNLRKTGNSQLFSPLFRRSQLWTQTIVWTAWAWPCKRWTTQDTRAQTASAPLILCTRLQKTEKKRKFQSVRSLTSTVTISYQSTSPIIVPNHDTALIKPVIETTAVTTV